MVFLDSSAFVKVVIAERESAALTRALASAGDLVASTLLIVEAGRVAMRYDEATRVRMRGALDGVTLIPMGDEVLRLAARLEPAHLRSLDAIHLATALSLGEGLDRFYCYDGRLASAAEALGLRVSAPG